MKSFFLLALAASWTGQGFAQTGLQNLFPDSTLQGSHPKALPAFKSSRLLLSNTDQTAGKHTLVFYVEHRFDDLAGADGGIKTFFGFDLATDINISFDYGISDRLTVGVGRCKGAPAIAFNPVTGDALYLNSLSQLWNASLKYRLLEQTLDGHMPVSVTLYANAVVSTMATSTDSVSDEDFGNLADRLSFTGQIIIARKFSEVFSAELLATEIHRDLVSPGDQADEFSLGAGGRYRYNAHQAVVMQYFFPIRSSASTAYYSGQGVRFYNPWAIGWEAETGGHVFQVLFTNATAISESQFIPYTVKSWTKGQFRWGFNLSRTFAL